MYKFILNFLLLLPMCIYSQNYKSNIDSLNIKASKYMHIDLDSAFIFASKAIEKSKISRYTVGEMEGKYQLGRVYYDQARRTLSLQAAEHSLSLAKKLDNYNGLKNAYNLIVKIHNHANQINDGIIATRRILNLAKEEGDSIEIAKAYNFYGIFKRKIGEGDSSLYFKIESIKINKKLKNEKALAYNYTSLGIYHYDNGNLDTAFSYLRKSLQIRKSLKLIPQTIESYNNIGYLFLMSEIADSAIIYFQKSIELCVKYGKKSNLHILYKNLSTAYKLSGNHELALLAIENSIPIADSLNGIKQKEQIIKVQEARNEELKLRNEIISLDKNKQFILIIVLILLFVSFYIISNISRKRNIVATLAIQKIKAAKKIINEYEKIDNWIAKELHDDIGGSISAIKLKLTRTEEEVRKAFIENMKEGNSIIEVGVNQYQLSLKSLKHEIDNLEDVTQSIRKLSHSLAPVTFKGQSFNNLIEDKITDLFPENYQITIQCVPEDELNKIEENLKFNVYRILQNLSSNIITHANATEANLQIIGHKDHLNIIVDDNGGGFEANNTTDGIGLQLIKKRVFLRNGTIEINSKLGRGTTIIIDLPYNIEEA